MHVLITRPRHQAEGTVIALNKLGHSCQLEPLLEIQTLRSASTLHGELAAAVAAASGMILTSSNALRALTSQKAKMPLMAMPVLTTGNASADAARRFGFKTVDHVAGSALELVAHVPDWMKCHQLTGRLFYPCAETTAHDLPALLAAQNIDCLSLPVYRTVPVTSFSEGTKNAFLANKIDGVLLYSKRTAHTFVQLMQQDEISMKGLRTYVMSRDILEALPKDLQTHAHFPEKPTEIDLLNLIGR